MTDPNADQTTAWNAEQGQTWVAEQATLDAQMAPVLDRLLDLLAIRPGERLVDIGCGTGTSTAAAADRAGAGGHVTGLDISALMLDRARARFADRANIDFLLADAQTQRFAQAFDAAFSRFGVMFFADPVAAFRTIAAGLRPGGRMVFAVWGPSSDNPWFAVPRNAAIARLGRPAPADPHAPGPFAFQDAARLHSLLTAADLRDVAVTTQTLVLTPPGTLDEVAAATLKIGPAAGLMRAASGTPADGAAIVQAVTGDFAEFQHGDGVRIPAAIHFATATAGQSVFGKT